MESMVRQSLELFILEDADVDIRRDSQKQEADLRIG